MFCRKPVEFGPVAYPIEGFETTRRGGGANRVLGRERIPGKVAHVYCAEKHVREKERGLVGQESLL
jgi:hypothetical protein